MANRKTMSMPKMVGVQATDITAPPSWAILQRKLMVLMEEAAPMMSRITPSEAERGTGRTTWMTITSDRITGVFCMLSEETRPLSTWP